MVAQRGKTFIESASADPWKVRAIMCFVYLFFGIHMAAFGVGGFMMAYSNGGKSPLLFLYAHSGIAILVYLAFYHVFFGRDEIRWMFINAALGIFGIYAQIGWILGLFGAQIGDYPWWRHIPPFLYYVLYTFLLRQFILDITNSRHNPARRVWTDRVYVVLSVLVYTAVLMRSA